MSRITLDAALVEKLQRADASSVEICDPAGNVIGVFTPKIDPSEFENWESPISEDELRRRAQSDGPRYTTAEVLRRLENL